LTGPVTDIDAGTSLRNLATEDHEKLTREALPLAIAEARAEDGVNDRIEDRIDECASDRAARAELAKAPWWLWWNILSLDAPMVAVVWALVFARSAGVALPGAEIGALGLVVWLIYTADRLLDGLSSAVAISNGTLARSSEAGAFGPPSRQRHSFHRVYAKALASTAIACGMFTAILVLTRIGEPVLKLSLPVGLVLVLYMAWVHLGRGRVLAQLPKEVAVGGIFALGVALPVWSRIGARRWEFLLLTVLFAAVCTLNCVAIEEWERVRARERVLDATSRRHATAPFASGKFAVALAVCATLLTPVVRLRGEYSTIGAAIAVSALLILFLDLMRERISAEGLRVLVDVALLLPALAVLAVR
jgi:hypothetical protein